MDRYVFVTKCFLLMQSFIYVMLGYQIGERQNDDKNILLWVFEWLIYRLQFSQKCSIGKNRQENIWKRKNCNLNAIDTIYFWQVAIMVFYEVARWAHANRSILSIKIVHRNRANGQRTINHWISSSHQSIHNELNATISKADSC